jgi:hypothetical protein
MSTKKQVNAINDDMAAAVAEVQQVPNRYTPDAQDRVTRLRAFAMEFPDDADPRPLTVADVRLAHRTTVVALEKAALFAEAVPDVGGKLVDVADLRDAIAFELAYGGVRDEAEAMVRRVNHAIVRRKLKAVRTARALYRVAKGYVTLDAGDAVRPHLAEMKSTLVRPARRKREEAPVVVAKK